VDGWLAVLDVGATEPLPRGWPERLGPLLAAGRDGDAPRCTIWSPPVDCCSPIEGQGRPAVVGASARVPASVRRPRARRRRPRYTRLVPPLQQPSASAVFWLLFALFAVSEWVVRIRSSFNRRGTRSERWSLVVVLVSVGVGLGGGLLLRRWPEAAITAGRWPVFVLGLALMAAGIAVRDWAIVTLGRFFTVDVRVHPDQTVVDRGPYRWVRHPAYTGLIVFFVGVGLALTNWASLVTLMIAPTAGLAVRIRSEERALTAGLGEPYRLYAAHRPRLFPGLW
jgi:protein-S-isoprenylcysteine O-methyltransferase Ste14